LTSLSEPVIDNIEPDEYTPKAGKGEDNNNNLYMFVNGFNPTPAPPY